ncbi:Tetratricopeptide TPR_2 repeat-containing protein [Methanobacterium lacus]|uniref:Tetratricopeptide TPR_2 repeat-containing protein n=1 Tax=Methanobacterium lacus (strain AL-21) TaxID=877455 RepID=F0T8W2_METLA|nr:Tetratricopeptide TPR_2 repeat-containing protein [Methanobacterium lacus]
MIKLDDFENALNYYDTIISLDPKDSMAYYNKGNTLYGLGKDSEANKNIDISLKLDPKNPDTLQLKGQILFEEDELNKALNYFNDALKLDSTHYFSLTNKIRTLNYIEKSDEAIKCVNFALKKYKKDPELLSLKGLSLALLEEYSASIEFYDKSLAIDPTNNETIWWKSLALWNLGRKQNAIDQLEKGLKIDPEDYSLLNSKGEFLRDLNQPEDALNTFGYMQSLYPDDPEILYQIGNLYKDLNDKEKSIQYYKKFVEMVRKNKILDLFNKSQRVQEYLNWIEETNEIITISPQKKPQYWQWSTKAEYYLNPDGSERSELDPGISLDPGTMWTCHKDTFAGDLILLYRAGKKKGTTYQDIKYLIMARSDAYPLEDLEETVENGWEYGCDFIPLYKFENSLELSEMRNDPYLEGWNALNALFHRLSYKTEEKYWKHLTDLLIDKNPDFANFMKGFDREKLISQIRTEKEVEDKLEQNINIFKRFNHDLEIVSRQERCRGDDGIIDLLCKDKNEGNFVVIELKINKANRNTFGQISGYMGWVMDHKPTGKSVKGIVVSRGYDNKFRSALKTNPNIEHIELTDVLSELDMKLI